MSTEINLKASDTELEQIKNGLLSSFTLFIKTFYKIRTGRDFEITTGPDGLPTQTFNGKTYKLWPNKRYFTRRQSITMIIS